MENQVTVKYSVKEEKFKTDELEQLNVDSDSRKNLTELFSNLSQNKKYLVMSKTTPIILWLVAVTVVIALIVLFVIIGFAAGRRRNDPNNPGNQNSMVTNESPENTIPGNNELSQVNKNSDGAADLTLTNDSTSDNDSFDDDQNSARLNSNANPFGDQNSRGRPRDSSRSKRGGLRLLQQKDGENRDNPQGRGRGFLDEMKVAIGFTCLVLLVFVVLLIMFECRKRHVFIHLKEFENSILQRENHSVRSQVEIQDNHSRKKILRCLPCFNVYDFNFIVRSLGPSKERDYLVDRNQQTNLRDSDVTLENFQQEPFSLESGNENKGLRLSDQRIHINPKMI